MITIVSYSYLLYLLSLLYFFFNDTATTEIYTLSLHDALPISQPPVCGLDGDCNNGRVCGIIDEGAVAEVDHWANACVARDRKSTRLNSSHSQISYAVFCLKKKKNISTNTKNSHNHNNDN